MWEEEDALFGEDELFEGSADKVTPSVPPLLMAAVTALPLMLGLAVVASLRPSCHSMAR